MSAIADWACLRTGRENFTVRPEVDAEFFFGRVALRDNVQRQLRYGLNVMGAPKMVLWGPYGAGKTHTLHHIKWYLEQEEAHADCETRVIKTPLMTKSGTFAAMHSRLVDGIGVEYVREAVNLFVSRDPSNWVENLADLVGDANVAHALRGLTLFGTMQLTAWRWLMGEKVQDVDQLNLNITRSYHAAEDLVQIIAGIGAMIRSVYGKRLIYLIDEAELLDGVTSQEALDSFVEAMRLLASDENRNVGFVIAAVRGTEDDGSMRVLNAGPVSGRLGEQNYINIEPLAAVSSREFVRDLLTELVDPACVAEKHPGYGLYPFTSEALELLEQWITEDPGRQLPRQIIQALNNGAFAAWEADEELVSGAAMARALDL